MLYERQGVPLILIYSFAVFLHLKIFEWVTFIVYGYDVPDLVVADAALRLPVDGPGHSDHPTGGVHLEHVSTLGGSQAKNIIKAALVQYLKRIWKFIKKCFITAGCFSESERHFFCAV